MKKLLCLFACLLMYITAMAQSPCNDDLCVIQFNANWNAANGVGWIDDLSDCSVEQIDIATDKEAQSKYKIVVVPTIIVFNGGEEVKRFQAGIMMTMEAKQEDVQEVIDEIIMSDF